MSSQVVPADIEINEKIVSSVISEQFSLAITSCEILGEGWDNLVYLINNILVFRFPRRLEAVILIEREISILKNLAAHLPLLVPQPTFIGQASPKFKRPFYGHQLIPGVSGCRVSLSEQQYRHAAKALGHFLALLHHIDPDKLELRPDELAPIYDRAYWPRMSKFFLERLESLKAHYQLDNYQAKIEQILAGASSYKPTRKPVLIQGDLYHRHLIFDAHQLSGIIDWGDAGIGDPVSDLGIVYQFFPVYAHQDFWHSYGPVSKAAKRYARFLGLYYAIAMLWYGHDRQDQDLIRTSLATLKMI